MSTELSDIYASGISNCCGAAVIDPSGEEKEGVCADCGEHCAIESIKEYWAGLTDLFNNNY